MAVLCYVEMSEIESESELGCYRASTVCSISFDLKSGRIRYTKSDTLDS